MNSKNVKTRNYLGSKTSFKLTRKKANNFNLPYPNQVPAGDYISRVVSAKETITKSGNDAIEVCYEIKEASICEKILNGKLSSNTNIPTYNIRQIYPLGTSFFDNYCEAMAEAVGIDEMDLDDTIGVTEHVTLDYGNATIGGYIGRHPLEPEKYDRIFRKPKLTKVNLLENQEEADGNDIKHEYKGKDLLENKITIDEDDEFDDFLEEDDE
ncbi:MAG: hypothetical protein II998_09540 [Clostridia bacterium]|nr:hypothetical protein [Clostridia bacterium]